MELADLIREMGAHLGHRDVEPDEDGGAVIVIDDTYEIAIERGEEGRGIVISATVGELPDEGREAVYAELLEANLMGQGAGAAALAIDPQVGDIVLCRVIPQSDLAFDDFDLELVGFAGALRFWRDRFVSGEIGKGLDGDARQDGAAASLLQDGAVPI